MGTLIRVVTGKKTDVFGIRQDRVVAAETTRKVPALSFALDLLARLVRCAARLANPCWRPATSAAAQGVLESTSPTVQRARAHGRLYRPEHRLRSY